MDKKKHHETGERNSNPDISSGFEKGVQVQLQGKTALNDPQSENPHVFPKPTTDPLDPLNWSGFRKHTILGIVMLKYFLFTYITTTTVPSFPEIQHQYGITYSQANWTVAVPALGLSLGPLIWSSLGEIYGRRLIFLSGTLIAFISTIGAAVANSYEGYMAARFFQGFGVSPASTVGMAIVNDLFFEFERGQKLGMWVLAVDSGLLLGPTFGGIFNLISASWINWFNAVLFSILLVLELFFMPETLYPRQHMLLTLTTRTQNNPSNDKEKNEDSYWPPGASELCRTTSLPFITLRPIPGIFHPKVWDSVTRLLLTFKFPVVVIAVLGYSFTWYWWTLSIITMVPAAYPQYTPLVQGFLFLGLSIGTLVSEILCSGRLSDYIVKRLMMRDNNVRTPEMRLWLSYPAIMSTAVGLVLWGISIENSYHWMVGQVAFFLFSAGIQIGNTVITSYIVDAYPLQSTSTITFYAVFFNLSAFVNPFFIANWESAVGWTWTFTSQALIVFCFSTSIVLVLHKFGPWLRNNSPKPTWVNPEYDLGM